MTKTGQDDTVQSLVELDSVIVATAPYFAPTYLLRELGKRGSKWGDFHWAMGCV